MPDAAPPPRDPQSQLVVFDLSNRVQIELRGADRQTFLNNFCTNDIKSLQPGQGCEAFLTSIKGRILAHLIVAAAEDSLWIDSVPGSNAAIVGHLDKYLITEDVVILDRTDNMGPLCLVAEESPQWPQSLAGIEELPLWGQQIVAIEGIDVIVRRVGFASSAAYEFVVAHDQREALTQVLTAAGATIGSADTFEALRIAAGFPHYGIDLTEENIAQEAARNDQAISFTKGCYLGQEPIARLDALGHTNKELRVLQLADGPIPESGVAVTNQSGDDVGRITSAAAHEEDKPPVAMAMLKTSATPAGTELTIGEATAIVRSVEHPDS